jgi:hypothetical protein
MYTLVDFVTHVKGIEYIMSLLAIAGFLLFWSLKPGLSGPSSKQARMTGHIEKSGIQAS